MTKKSSTMWMRLVGVIGVIFGVFYSIFGLNGLPVYKRLVSETVYTPWSNGLYGSVFIGFSVLLYFVGRHAFAKNDKSLMKALLYGVIAWLAVEAFYSFIYGVYFNIGVDILLAIVLGFPLIKGMRSK